MVNDPFDMLKPENRKIQSNKNPIFIDSTFNDSCME